MLRFAVLLLLISPSPRAADLPDYEVEKFAVLGWGDGCSVAVSQYGYPREGQALIEDPIAAKIAVLSMPPGQLKQKDEVLLSLHGPWSWREKEAQKVLAQLRARGYTKPGTEEPIGLNMISPERDLPRLLNTTDALKPAPGKPWPDRAWRWTKIVYQPVGQCALFVYEKKRGANAFYDYALVHIDNPAARADRANAHLTNALLILQRGELTGALSELEIASRLSPENAVIRYHHAALMALTGVVEPTVDELEIAIKLDPQYKKKAKKDKDFENLRWHPKFKALTGKQP